MFVLLGESCDGLYSLQEHVFVKLTF